MRDNPLSSLGVTVDDLAPDEFRAIDFDWTGLSVRIVRSPHDEYFDRAYRALWGEFGPRNEMESRPVIEQRLKWTPRQPIGGHALLYELIVIHGSDGLVAVHDHTAVLNLADPSAPLVVHISHVFVIEAYRGSGLAGWMRALPLRTARDLFRETNTLPRPITLVAEMEPIDARFADRIKRLRSYERGGYVKIDPSAIDYTQPDFREPAAIDATGGPQPVRLSLVVRRVGRENETTTSGTEVRQMVEALYHIYRQSIRPQDMRLNDDSLAAYPADHARIALLPPTRAVAVTTA